MEIYTDIDREWPSDHPVLRELEQTEKSIYWSCGLRIASAMDEITEYLDENGELDPEDPELSQTKELLQGSLALAETLEELAEWRKGGVILEVPEVPEERNVD